MNTRAVLAALLLLPLVPASGAATTDPLRIAVIDTGIDASHPEFAPGQVVAWRDFTPERSATPKDGHGHGTATASLVAGRNVGGCGSDALRPKLSFAPGAQLVVARVGNDKGEVVGNIDAAFDWAVAQGADVISMSIGGIAPLPA
ncbi:MAG TPA: S8 family serine peptidase, partial [Candidatus Thermoplasmatota archaeon]|nr:S8 family serine peptidase [Candidatus Thermoplasmatota archaeon]